MLKAEMIQAGYGLETNQHGLKINNWEFKLLKDVNLDQDLLNPELKKLSRKSGKVYFQTLIEPLNFLDFQSVSTSTKKINHGACVKIRYQFENNRQILEAFL